MRQFQVVFIFFCFGCSYWSKAHTVVTAPPMGEEDTTKLPCLEEEEVEAACSMPLKPGTLCRQLAILVGAFWENLKSKPIIYQWVDAYNAIRTLLRPSLQSPCYVSEISVLEAGLNSQENFSEGNPWEAPQHGLHGEVLPSVE